jgi:hypothetical protein
VPSERFQIPGLISHFGVLLYSKWITPHKHKVNTSLDIFANLFKMKRINIHNYSHP